MATSRPAPFVLLALARGLAAQEPVDLLDSIMPPTIALYGAKVSTARIVILRTDDEARAFAGEAFGEDKKELHVDFAKERVVALCWGPRRVDYDFRGGTPELRLDHAVIADKTLQLTLRTLLPLGEHGEPDDTANCRVWYPAVFLRAPVTERVRVDVVGARCRDM